MDGKGKNGWAEGVTLLDWWLNPYIFGIGDILVSVKNVDVIRLSRR